MQFRGRETLQGLTVYRFEQNIPDTDLDMRCDELDPLVDLVVVSEHGIRSFRACGWLAARGYLKVVNLVGGLSEFRFPLTGKASLPPH